MKLSKCCNSRLIRVKEDYGVYGTCPTKYLYCSKCGLVYYEINNNKKYTELDEWD